MICKCPKCNGALEYDPTMHKMTCKYCGNIFKPDEIKNNSVEGAFSKESEKCPAEDTMECRIYTCTSCAGELAVNDVEVATFCPYCGQPTIVFSRVSQELRPEKIIPFRIQREKAIQIIRKRLSRGFFVPKEVKNFEVERVRGIYIPYFLFDAYYYDYQKLKGYEESREKGITEEFYIREAECEFQNLTVDASKMLNDEVSQCLEPYDMEGLKPFEIAYLSGFYADRYDMSDKNLEEIARERCEEMFDDEMRKDIEASKPQIVRKEPKFELRKTQYVLLPAWFMTLRYKNETYTFLVNGQTGKMIGAVPIAKGKLILLFVGIVIVASILFCFLGRLLFNKYTGLKGFAYALTGLIPLYSAGIASYTRVFRNIKRAKEKKTAEYVKERQDET